MRLSKAIELLESEGLLLERIKKYRTTPEERRFRDNRSSTDEWSLREKLHKIANENGLEPYCNSISVNYPKDPDQINIEIDFRGLSGNDSDTLKKLASSLGITSRGNRLQFLIPIKTMHSQTKAYQSVMIGRALQDKFNVPPKITYEQVIRWPNTATSLYQAYKDEDIVEADSIIKEMYDRLEAWIEKEQYGGIQNLTYDGFRDAVYGALDDYASEDNQDKYVTNQYGQERKINKMYYDFSKFCRIFSKEINRQRGVYRPQA